MDELGGAEKFVGEGIAEHAMAHILGERGRALPVRGRDQAHHVGRLLSEDRQRERQCPLVSFENRYIARDIVEDSLDKSLMRGVVGIDQRISDVLRERYCVPLLKRALGTPDSALRKWLSK